MLILPHKQFCHDTTSIFQSVTRLRLTAECSREITLTRPLLRYLCNLPFSIRFSTNYEWHSNNCIFIQHFISVLFPLFLAIISSNPKTHVVRLLQIAVTIRRQKGHKKLLSSISLKLPSLKAALSASTRSES